MMNRRGQCVAILSSYLALPIKTMHFEVCIENEPASPPKFRFKHADTIGPPYMHHFFMSALSAGHGILNF